MKLPEAINKNNPTSLAQKGVISPLLILIAAIGLIAFLIFTNTLDFKNKLYSLLYPKPASQAAGGVVDKRFAVGASTNALSQLYSYDWDNFSYHLQVVPDTSLYQTASAPNQKFAWMIGKLDPRGDGKACLANCTQDNINTIFNSEKPQITALLAKDVNKGGVWIVGNEDNWYPQLSPQLYANQFGQYYNLIKGLDPTAKLAFSGLVIAPVFDPSKPYCKPYPCISATDFLKQFLDASGQPPDILNIHLYSTSATSATDGASGNITQAQGFKTFVNSDSRIAQKPIWITEFGIGALPVVNMDFSIAYLNSMVNFFKSDNQFERWFWFLGPYDSQYPNSVLTNPDGTLTALGKAYLALAIPPIPVLASITGPTSGIVGQSLKYTITATGTNLTKVDVYRSPTSPSNSTGDWTAIAINQLCNGSSCTVNVSWTPSSSDIKSWYVVANATDANGTCSGNPFVTYPYKGITNCGSNDKVSVNITSAPTNIRPALCQGMNISNSILSSGQSVSITSTAKSPVNKFMYAFYNSDNSDPTTGPKGINYYGGPAQYTRNIQLTTARTQYSISVTYKDMAKPDNNWGGRIPKNIQVNGYFFDSAGHQSVGDSKCVVNFTLR